MNLVEHFLRTAESLYGIPYKWGGGDARGFDCSGFAIECLQSVRLFPLTLDMTADQLMKRFRHLQLPFPVPGALLFRLNEHKKAVHVEVCLDGKFKIGSNGGGRSTKTVSDAWRIKAGIKKDLIKNKTNQVFVYPFAWK